MTDDNDAVARVLPVILCGGAGSRLWPSSRTLYPKQFLPLTSDRSLLQETVQRIADPALFAAPLVVCQEDQRFLVAEHLRAVGIAARAILLEPEGRNTAPAAAAAALVALREGSDSLLLVLPSDHAIPDPRAFRDLVRAGVPAARDGALVTFGMHPTQPETGYGYIRSGAPLDGADGAFRVARFVEKPDLETARSMLGEEGWLWNSGIFLFSAATYLAQLERHAPDILAACQRAVDEADEDPDYVRLASAAFSAAPGRSIDVAVMEKTDIAAVVPAQIGWSDVGSWAALWDLGDKDESGNIMIGETVVTDTRDSYIRAESRLVATAGVEDLVVVETGDAVLITRRDRAQDVRAIVAHLRRNGSDRVDAHIRVHRPWGYYESLDSGTGFQVKHISVKPGARLSLQAHRQRAEHWIVTRGTARVTRDDEVFDLAENQSTYIPLGARHRLENPGTGPLDVIEVQSGDYLGEDDIIRFDDVYGRVSS